MRRTSSACSVRGTGCERKRPIGSGMQEAAHKTPLVERLKQSGVSRSSQGGDAILLF